MLAGYQLGTLPIWLIHSTYRVHVVTGPLRRKLVVCYATYFNNKLITHIGMNLSSLFQMLMSFSVDQQFL